VKLAIHGLGRVGRLVLRQLVHQDGVEIVAVQDPADTRTLAHLITYDSVHGKADFPVSWEATALLLDGKRIPVIRETKSAPDLFAQLDARIVLECTGQCTSRQDLARFLQGGVSHVLVANPVDDADLTLVLGVNDARLDLARQRVISHGSCTGYCLAPMVKVLDEAFGIDYGLFTAVHAYTNDQRILDLPHKDLRRARAAFLNMIPTSTGAVQTIGRVLPHLAGRLDGLAVRVPTPDVSILDLSAMLTREATLASLNTAFTEAAASDALRGYLAVAEEELVSVDFRGNPASCIFDPFLTKIMTPRYVKIFGWYDNEFGFASRLGELAVLVLGRLQGEDLR